MTGSNHLQVMIPSGSVMLSWRTTSRQARATPGISVAWRRSGLCVRSTAATCCRPRGQYRAAPLPVLRTLSGAAQHFAAAKTTKLQYIYSCLRILQCRANRTNGNLAPTRHVLSPSGGQSPEMPVSQIDSASEPATPFTNLLAQLQTPLQIPEGLERKAATLQQQHHLHLATVLRQIDSLQLYKVKVSIASVPTSALIPAYST